MMKRREFIALVGGAAASSLLAQTATRAQPAEPMKRLGMLMARPEESEGQARTDAFLQTLQQRGWVEGRNIHIDKPSFESGLSNARVMELVADLVALRPDVIFAATSRIVVQVRAVTTSIPVVFAAVSDPVGQGLVKTLARPGGPTTGFSNLEFSLVAKWLQLLKEVVPGVQRAVMLLSAQNGAFPIYVSVLKEAATTFGITASVLPVRTRADIESVIAAFASRPSGALVLAGDIFLLTHRELVVAAAARHRLPAVYANRAYVVSGGLMSYGHDNLEPYRGAASYVDRILRGEKPGDLPVQAPTKYELVLNLKTAKAMRIEMPPGVLVRADEVIE
jgi:putative ABC transport system substrate-binding protein